MSKGTIIYLGGFELPDKNAAAHRVLSNGKIIRNLGYDVVFINVDKSLNFDSNIFDTKKNIQGFECWSVPYPKFYNEWIKYLTDIGYVKLIRNQYDDVKAIIAYNYPSVGLYKLKKYCHKNNFKIISDCTEWYNSKNSNVIFKMVKGFDTFSRMRIVQKQMDGLIVISRYLEKYYQSCNNVIRIPPLIDIREEKWHIISHKESDDKIKFVYSGSPGKNKDKINQVVAALGELKEYHNYSFAIVGITKKQYLCSYPEHEATISLLGKRIDFLGRVSHLESLNVLQNADFSIFIRDNTRVTEAGFPTKFVESTSCGVPVITTNTSDLGEYLKNGENGFFIMKDVKEVLEKVITMTPQKINIMRKAVDHNTFNLDNYEKIFKQLIEVF